MADRVGTSGWSHDEWKGRFYPENMASSDMLSFYAERLAAVEVNNTFYRLPKRDVLAAWAAQVPETFRFVLKADRALLEAFLDWIPEGVRAAFEFRSRSWFEDDVIDLLAQREHAFAAADTGDPDKDPPLAAGGGWCHARLRREDYDEAALVEWARRLRALPVDDRYVFFKHEDEAAGPALAARFATLLAGDS